MKINWSIDVMNKIKSHHFYKSKFGHFPVPRFKRKNSKLVVYPDGAEFGPLVNYKLK